MSKDKNMCDKYMNESKEDYNACKGVQNCNNVKSQLDSNRVLLNYYEDSDSKDIFTSNGRDLLYKAKDFLLYAIIVGVMLTLLSMKKTLDNIDARVHNAPSVTTK